MRLPYVPDPPPVTSAPEQAIVSRIRSRRAPNPLQALDLTLLHSPPVADGWNSFLGAIRTRTSLPVDIREVAICRVAVLNQAWYEWMHHAPLASAGGVSDAGLRSLLETASVGGDGDVEGLTEKQAAVKAYTDAMTKDVVVGEEVFARVKRLFSEREVVEITATVAAYNCVSRFLVALDVGEQNGKKPE
ncbi:MAG: hypothetical protein M1830_009104 [Pleopsidium flavum]|nr:MAG: hypothetical protein M1830_009104 [Pleopsidium flavum]